jgi:hypothetical protein
MLIGLSLLATVIGWKSLRPYTLAITHRLNLIIGIAVTAPIMVYHFSSLDEFFVLGYFMHLCFSKIRDRTIKSFDYTINSLLIFIFSCYWVFELLQGYYLFDSYSESYLPKIRWLFFILCVIFLYFTFTNSPINELNVTRTQFCFILIFLILTISIFLFYLLTTGSTGNAQNAQGHDSLLPLNIFTNTAYFSLSLIFFSYLSFYTFTHSKDKFSLYASYTVILLCYTIAILVFSRSTFACLLFVHVLSHLGISFKNISLKIFLRSITLLIFPYLFIKALENLTRNIKFNIDYSSTLAYDLSNLINLGDRIKQYSILREYFHQSDLLSLAIGRGLRTSELVLSKLPIHSNSDSSQFDLYFIPNLLIEFGILGTLLFLLLVFFNIKDLLFHKSEVFLNFGLIFAFLFHGLIVNIFDNLLFYIIVLRFFSTPSKKISYS